MGKCVKYVWTATAVCTIYKPCFIDICRSDNTNMITRLCESSMDEQCQWGDWVFPSNFNEVDISLLCS